MGGPKVGAMIWKSGRRRQRRARCGASEVDTVESLGAINGGSGGLAEAHKARAKAATTKAGGSMQVSRGVRWALEERRMRCNSAVRCNGGGCEQ